MSSSGTGARDEGSSHVHLSWPGDDPGRRPSGARRLRAQPAADDDDLTRDVPQVLLPLPSADADLLAGASVRRAVVEAHDRLADRLVQRLRGLRDDIEADFAELRSEMAALRQAVDDVGDRIPMRQLRSSLEDLRGDLSGARRARASAADLHQVAVELEALRSEVAALRRRITLRAPSEERAGLSDEQIDQLATAIAERMAAEARPRRRR